MLRVGVGVACLSLLITLVCIPCFPQTSTATLLGTVRDPSGAVVPDAQVTIRNVGTNAERPVLSNEVGEYAAPLLQPGEYEVVVQIAGFKRFVQSGITLRVNDVLSVPIPLQVGLETEEVTVQSDASVLERDNSTLGTVIDRDQVVELPLNGRDFFHLTYLVPGAAPGADGSRNMEEGGGAVSVNGMRDQANNFLLDGVDNNMPLLNFVSTWPPLDSVQEFKVQSGISAAEFGTHFGAQLNFVTKSGTNRFSGSLYWFHRNAVLDAKNYFDLPDEPIPKFIRNQFGFSIGGPMVKDRTFFFGNFEGLRERKAITRLATVPPPEFIAGDFSSLLPGKMIHDPGTGIPFPDNVIPPEAMDPIGSALAGYFPAPNSDRLEGNLFSHPTREIDLNQIVLRLDHEIGEQDSLFARYAISDEDRYEPFFATNIPGFGENWINRGQNLSIGWIHTFHPQLINDLRLAYNRFHGGRFHEWMGNDVASQLGIQGLSTHPLAAGFPATNVIGFDSLKASDTIPHDHVDNVYQLINGLSWHRGRHIFKLGGDIRHIRENALEAFLSRGDFWYTKLVSGHSVADLLLGRPTVVFGGTGDANSNVRNWSFALYFQDDFKLNRNLTLNYGLRYEYSQPPYEVFGRYTLPDLAAADPPGRFIQCGTEGIPRGCCYDDKNNFAPRLGMAWSPQPESGFVIRAGYGIYYEVGMFAQNYGLSLNPPNYALRVSYVPTSLSTPFETGIGGDPKVSPFYKPVDFPLAHAHQWSLNIQRSLRESLFEIGYVGSSGSNLFAPINQNQVRPDGTRAYPAYAGFWGQEAGVYSNYHALWIRFQRRFINGLSYLVSYTFGKSIDEASSYPGSDASASWPQDAYDLRSERGLSDFDNRHRLVLSYVWQLPVGQGQKFLTDLSPWAEALVGGWQLTGIFTFQSTRPFTAGLDTGDDVLRPDLVGDPHLANPDPSLWINPSAFSLPEGRFGTAGRNILRGPGYQSLDLGLAKQWSLSDTSRLQFRAEFFNLFNHPNFDLPEGNFNSKDFGSVQSAKDSRQIQFGLRLQF